MIPKSEIHIVWKEPYLLCDSEGNIGIRLLFNEYQGTCNIECNKELGYPAMLEQDLVEEFNSTNKQDAMPDPFYPERTLTAYDRYEYYALVQDVDFNKQLDTNIMNKIKKSKREKRKWEQTEDDKERADDADDEEQEENDYSEGQSHDKKHKNGTKVITRTRIQTKTGKNPSRQIGRMTMQTTMMQAGRKKKKETRTTRIGTIKIKNRGIGNGGMKTTTKARPGAVRHQSARDHPLGAAVSAMVTTTRIVDLTAMAAAGAVVVAIRGGTAAADVDTLPTTNRGDKEKQ